MLFVSVRMRGNFSPARNVLSTTAPDSSAFSFVRTKAPPLPGFTCWNSTMRQTPPSSSMCMPFLNWFVETVSATPLLRNELVDRGLEVAHLLVDAAGDGGADDAQSFDDQPGPRVEADEVLS